VNLALHCREVKQKKKRGNLIFSFFNWEFTNFFQCTIK
jgi:hypothetical protein